MVQNSFKFFFNSFVKPHVLTFGILLALNFFSLVFSFVSPLLTKSLVDDVFIGKRVEIFVYIIMGIVGIYCMSSISGYFAGYISGKLQLILLKEVSESAFNVVQSTSVKSTQGMKVGDLITRIMSNTQVAINIPVSVIPHFIMSLIGIIIPFIIMLSLNVHLALIITSPVILFVLSSFIFGKKMEIIQKAFLEINGEVYSFLKENISIIPLIKVFGLEKWSQNRFKNQMDNYYNISIGYTKINSMNASLSTLILGIPVVLLIFFGGYMVLNGSISIGTFTAFISYISIFFSPISQLSNFWTSYKSSLPAFDRVKEIFDMEHEIGGHKEIEIKNGEIQLENVWFSYGERPILKGVSAIFGKGLNYIVGDNGTGKSTILKLICLFYPVNNGIIKLEGHNIAEIKKDCLNRNISMIFSEPYIFDGSIYENIKIGNLHASMDQVIQVAKKVKIHEFIENTSAKYDTQVGENGMALSSGEKQKIALARAILKNSPIILLDEVTKSIDSDSRESINEVIKDLKNEKTIIIVTHNADEIEQDSNIIYLKPEANVIPN